MKTFYSMMLGILIFTLLVFGILRFSGGYFGDTNDLFPKIVLKTTPPPPTKRPVDPSKAAVVEIVDFDRYVSDSGEFVTIVGEVKNVGDTDAFYVKLTANYYDLEDNLVQVHGEFADDAMLAPDKTSRFEIMSPNKPEMERVEVVVSWK